MPKMTNAAARKRLNEARKKIDAVAFGDAARFLTASERGKLYKMSNDIIALIKKMGGTNRFG
tara:strand:+ start:196 stop:381 length:186 start_codon:yes stop_codon:yes gene_type:complete